MNAFGNFVVTLSNPANASQAVKCGMFDNLNDLQCRINREMADRWLDAVEAKWDAKAIVVDVQWDAFTWNVEDPTEDMEVEADRMASVIESWLAF